MADDFKLIVEHGSPAQREVDVTWADGSPRDISGTTPILTVYTGSSDLTPVLFSVPGSIDPDDSTRGIFQIDGDDTVLPKSSYYATIDITDGGVIQVDGRWHGSLKVTGR